MAPRSTIFQGDKKSCTKCKVIKTLADFYTTGKKVGGEPKYNSWCKLCVKEKMASYHKSVYGPEKFSFVVKKRTQSVRAYLQYLLAKARKRAPVEVDISHLLCLWDEQGGKCALSGWDMTMILGKGVVGTNISIDRIDSDFGYVPGNVQLVCRMVNVAKSNYTMYEFLQMCESVVRRKDG